MDLEKFCNYVADTYLKAKFGHLSEDEFDLIEREFNDNIYDPAYTECLNTFSVGEHMNLPSMLKVIQTFGDWMGWPDMEDFLVKVFTPDWDKEN